ncbi:pyruvate kinase [Zopfochytrium polystomum]|nr:pyruvate kinase [Zopfochytrium polystomum]
MAPTSHPAYIQGTADVLRTKIVCTIGPASAGIENIGRLVESGMNVCRLNLTHCTHEFAASVIHDLRTYLLQKKHTAEVAVWVDINGPKVRTGRLKEPSVYLKAGDDFLFVNDPNVVGDNTRVASTYSKELMKPGDLLYVDDGLLSFTVLERLEDAIRCRVENSGWLGENKGINIPAYVIEDLPAVSPKDAADIDFALSLDVDFLSVSCIRNIDDVEEARLLLGNSKVKLLAKVENKRGMDNFESILKLADGVVIDRGYLGAEVDIEEVTMAQKRMIARANVLGKSVLIANQMLESMKNFPRPTRSEAAGEKRKRIFRRSFNVRGEDIANAVMDGADGLVLSAETATGSYVFEALSIMRKVAYKAELNTNYTDFQVRMTRSIPKPIGVSESIASSAVVAARQVNAAIIICVTEYGGTARLVAKYRPQIPVIAATLVKQTARQLATTFGLVPYHHTDDAENVIPETVRFAASLGLCKPGDIAVITSGQSIGFLEGTTTKMQLYTVPAFQ